MKVAPAAVASLLAATVLGPAGTGIATADGIDRDRLRPRGAIEIGVDALALIEWWERRAPARARGGTRSSVAFRSDSRTLLFHCGPAEALIVSAAPLRGDGSSDLAARVHYGCGRDQALYGDPMGTLSCRPFAGRIGRLGDGPLEIVINADPPVALSGACSSPGGAITPAYVPIGLAGTGGLVQPARPCPDGASGVTFRGAVQTGCGR